MTDPAFHPRFVLPRLIKALEDTPVVLIHGPRQYCKTTLARAVGDAAGHAYVSFDGDVLRASAQADWWVVGGAFRRAVPLRDG